MKQWIINLLLATWAVITPVFPLFVTIFILIICDFLFGLYRAWKTKEEISSRKMSHTISKILLYELAILALFLIEKYVIMEEIPLTKIVAGVIAMVELKSIDESFQKIFGFSIYNNLKDKLQRSMSETKNFKNK